MSLCHELEMDGFEITLLDTRHPPAGSTFTLVMDVPVEYEKFSRFEDILRGYYAMVWVLLVFSVEEQRRFLTAASFAGVKGFVTIEPGFGHEQHHPPAP